MVDGNADGSAFKSTPPKVRIVNCHDRNSITSVAACRNCQPRWLRYTKPFVSKLSFPFPIEEIDVFFVCETGSGNEFFQKTHTERFSTVDRYRQVNIASFFYQYVMTPLYVIHLPTSSFEGSDMFITACSWESNHVQ